MIGHAGACRVGIVRTYLGIGMLRRRLPFVLRSAPQAELVHEPADVIHRWQLLVETIFDQLICNS